ncbi:inactive poly [ADP-ribose] polymerase RCD1-like isoform X1, partial [Tanacetum coccineum]
GIQQDSKASRVTSLLGIPSSGRYERLTFRKGSKCWFERTQDPKSPWMSFSELIEAVYDKVAPTDMRLIHVLNESFRAKKMNRDEFIRKLRSVVGD